MQTEEALARDLRYLASLVTLKRMAVVSDDGNYS